MVFSSNIGKQKVISLCVWSITVDGTRLVNQRRAGPTDKRFHSTPPPEDQAGSVQLVVGFLGGRELVTFKVDGDPGDLRTHLEGLRGTPRRS